MNGTQQTPAGETPLWTWPVDDRTPVDITNYYVTTYAKRGLSSWIGAARQVEETAEAWKNRRKAPIQYLLKVATDAIHERLYYVLARRLDLPQQQVFWAVNPRHDDLIGVAIRFEKEAFFLSAIDLFGKTATYRRKVHLVPNADDFLRHGVLHSYCGTGDIHQAMVKQRILFGIDAADCLFHAPFGKDSWRAYLAYYRTKRPEALPIILDMMERIARHPELPELLEQELLAAPGEVLNRPLNDVRLSSANLRAMHSCLIQALE